ncbi:MAG TPA: acetylglutamate kinase [Spirochaetia bacterium]|nr:acetylglutamate kinase [Spirochaetia bacterium]
MTSGSVLVKIGGRAADDETALACMAEEMLALSRDYTFLLVHGGGAEVTALSKKLGIQSVFANGLRQTTAAEMDIVDMVLAGKVNKQLVRLLRARGLDAVGLSGSDGGLLVGKSTGALPDGTQSRTGEVAAVDDRLLRLLLDKGFLPVISSPSMDAAGLGLNVNADTAAFTIAVALGCSALVFLSDIPGIISDGSVIRELTAEKARTLSAAGVISGGMLPKVSASVDALSKGVQTVIIGHYEESGSLARLLEGRKGTRIWK